MVFATLFALMPLLPAQTYSVIDLGLNINPTAINNLGEVVGSINLPHSDPHAFLYKKHALQDLSTVLPTLPKGHVSSNATGINDLGDIVGAYFTSAWFAFIYNGTKVSSFDFNGGLGGSILAINNSLESLTNFRANSSLVFEALYTGGTLLNVGTLPYASDPNMVGINNAGQIVGTIEVTTSPFFATIIYHSGHLQDIGTFYPSAINDAGQVVGQTIKNFACLYAGGHLTNLGTLPGTVASEALYINAGGEIVGLCYPTAGETPGSTRAKPFVYKGGVMRPLLVPTWTVFDVTGINNAGQIIGKGYVGNNPSLIYGLLLTPQ
jgi:probable HAF family extracellular repeat protein